MLGDTANVKQWVIIACEFGGDGRFGPLIPPSARPTTFQSSREQAEAELLRLEAKYQRAFALFESVAYARRVGGPDRISDDPATPFAYVVEPIVNDMTVSSAKASAVLTPRFATAPAAHCCRLHGDLHVRVHNGTLLPLTGEKIVGFDVDVEFGVPPRVETFHWRGTEAAVRRKAIFKSHFRRVVAVRAITDSEWNRGFGDPALRESLYRC